MKSSGKMAKLKYDRSSCPVAATLDIIGDKWTLLVVRDIFLDRKRYNQFLESPEAIPTNILADRLKRLESHGLVRKTPYQDNPVRYEYELTQKGLALGPVLKSIVQWGGEFLPGTTTDPAAVKSAKRK